MFEKVYTSQLAATADYKEIIRMAEALINDVNDKSALQKHVAFATALKHARFTSALANWKGKDADEFRAAFTDGAASYCWALLKSNQLGPSVAEEVRTVWHEWHVANKEFKTVNTPSTSAVMLAEDDPPMPSKGKEKMSEDDDFIVPSEDKAKAKAARRAAKAARQKANRKVQIDISEQPEMPTVEVTSTPKPSSHFSGKGVMSWLGFAKAHSVPYRDGKQVKWSEFESAKDKTLYKWVEVEAEQFIDLSNANYDSISAAISMHMFPSDMHGSWMARAKSHVAPVQAPAYTRADAIEKFGQRQVDVAEILYYCAKTEEALLDAQMASKTGVFKNWFSYLLSNPAAFPNVAAAKVYHAWVKRACKSETPLTSLNATSHSIALANLQVWDAGQSREAMLKNSIKSVKAVWGDSADLYIEEFKKTDSGRMEVKPRFKFVSKVKAMAASRVASAKETFAEVASKVTSKVSEVTQGAKEDVEEILEDTEEFSPVYRMRILLATAWFRVTSKFRKAKKATAVKLPFVKKYLACYFKDYTLEKDENGKEIIVSHDARWWASTKHKALAPVRLFKRCVRWMGYQWDYCSQNDLTPDEADPDND